MADVEAHFCSSERGSIARSLLLAVAAFALLGGASPIAAQPTPAPPNFGNVPDILGGQSYLLRADDLIAGELLNLQRDLLLTSGLHVQSQALAPVVGAVCGGQLPQPAPFQSRAARLFNTDHDVVVHLAPLASAGAGCTGTPNFALYVEDPHVAANRSQTNIAISPNGGRFALGDLDRDGHPELVLLDDQSIIIYSAVDVDDPTQGLHEVARTSNPSAPTPRDDPVTADFNGDGALDLAWPTASDFAPTLDSSWRVSFASFCPRAGAVVLGQTCTQAFQLVPVSHTIAVGAGADPAGSFDAYAALTAGNYAGALNPTTGLATAQLVVSWTQIGNGNFSVLGAYSFDAGLAPQLRTTLAIPAGVFLEFEPQNVTTGRIAWFGETDQVVFAGTFSKVVSVVTFDENLVMTAHSAQIPNGGSTDAGTNWTMGVAVGRFDPPPAGGAANPNLQIARLAMLYVGVPGFAERTFLEIYEVDPTTSFTPTLVSTFTLASQRLFGFNSFKGAPFRRGNPLGAGDLQARSLALGSPQKVTVTGSIQPQVVLGMPPMHLDFVQPAGSDPNDPPSFLNVSARPSHYYAEYTTQQSGTNQSSNTNTTSYTLSTKESIDEKTSFGDPDVASIGEEVKTAAEQTHEGSVADKYDTYSAQQFDVSTQTGFSDVVWYTAKRFNIYNYRVLGQCVADAGAEAFEGCPAGTRPLYLQLSGPDQVTNGRIDGSLLEWYQPVHEPGNVLSYPWNAGFLQDLYAGFSPLTEDPATTWATDTSGSTVSVSWSQGSGSSVTSGTVSTQSLDVSASVTGSVSVGLFDGSLDLGFDYNKSSSTATLNESSSTLGSSTGIRVVKPPFLDPGDYAYTAQTYIFGQDVAPDRLQQIPLGTTVTSNGPLWTGFVANPTDRANGAGAWWTGGYAQPDVALNHPLRWKWTPETPSDPDMFAFNDANPEQPASSDFYVMRGLYVTPASSDGEGPQTTQAAAGDPIRLEARVYNYSLADMPADARVRVRFYGQPWNHQTSNFGGDPFVIDEVLLAPIPGFASGSAGQAPNWTLASTTFDTTGHGDSYLVFWVVVWMQEGTLGDGAMVPEQAGHGLVALPGPGTFPVAVEIERFSNNVGFYDQPFFVCPSACGAPPGATVGDGPTIDALEIAPKRVRQFEPATITATLAASSDVGHDGVHVAFYDGDPAQGGEAFDANLVPHIRPGDVYATEVSFLPRTCGPHQIFVVAGTETASAKLKVDCVSDGTEGVFAGRAKRVGSGKADGELTLVGDVVAPGPIDLRAATATIGSLLLDGGKGELVRGPGGAPFLPLELEARRGRKHGQHDETVFETPPGARPYVRLEVEERNRWWRKQKEDRLALALEVERAWIRRPSGRCGEGKGTAELGTSLTLADPRHPPIALNPVLTWRCGKRQLWTWDKLGPAGRPVRSARGSARYRGPNTTTGMSRVVPAWYLS
jgi:hypothetical protein